MQISRDGRKLYLSLAIFAFCSIRSAVMPCWLVVCIIVKITFTTASISCRWAETVFIAKQCAFPHQNTKNRCLAYCASGKIIRYAAVDCPRQLILIILVIQQGFLLPVGKEPTFHNCRRKLCFPQYVTWAIYCGISDYFEQESGGTAA